MYNQNMKRQAYILVGLFFVLITIWSINAEALMPGTVKEYTSSSMDKVTFSADSHIKNAGFDCNSCHPRLFSSKDFKAPMSDHMSGKKCFACHNDTVAPKTCAFCHKK